MAADFTRAGACATALLLDQRLYRPRIDVAKLRYRQRILFDTFANYCANSCDTLARIKQYADMRDGCTLIRGDLHIVLISDEITHMGRRNFTLAHEVGHICMGHKTDGPDEEAEANHFAAQLLLPPVWVWYLLEQSGFKLTADELGAIFGVSVSAAQNRLQLLRKTKPVFSEDEQALLHKYLGILPQVSGPYIDLS